MNTFLIVTDIVTALITASISIRLFQYFGKKENVNSTHITIFAVVFSALEIAARTIFGRTTALLGIGYSLNKMAMGETWLNAFCPDGTVRIFFFGWYVEAGVIMLMMLVAAAIFRTSKEKAVRISILFTAVIMFAEIGMLKLLPIISGTKEAACIISIAYYFIASAAIRLIIFAAATGLYYCTPAARDKGCLYGRIKTFLVLFVIPIVTMISSYAAFEWEIKIGFSDEYLWLMAGEILAVCDIVLVFSFEHSAVNIAKSVKTELVVQQAAYKADYYKEIAENKKTADKTMHDLKNRMFALKEIFSNDNSEGLQKLEEICEALTGSMIQDITGNEALDALISAKKIQMKKEGIAFSSVCFVHSFENISNDDLSIILGNLLDNAIEACQKITEGKRRISLEMIQKGDFLNVTVINTIAQQVLIEKGMIRTTKKQKELHGFGIENIEETAAKYNGTISFEQDDNSFTASVILCILAAEH